MGALFIRLIGLLWISAGIFGLIATQKAIALLSNFMKKAHTQSLGLLQLIFGVLLLIFASGTKEAWFVVGLGILSCLKGATAVLMSEKDSNQVLNWGLSAPEVVHKGCAVFLVILGVAMFYIV